MDPYYAYLLLLLLISIVVPVVYYLLYRKFRVTVYRPMVFTERNPGFAAILSLIIPGFGQAYNREFLKMLKYLFVFIIGLAVLFSGPSGPKDPYELVYVWMLIVYVYAIRDAYKSAIRMNEFLAKMSQDSTKG